MLLAGFDRIEILPVERIERRFEGRQVLTDYFLDRESSSTLAALGDEEYRQGVRRLEQRIVESERTGISVSFDTRMELVLLTGWRTGG